MMVVGIVLLFLGSVSITANKVQTVVARLPVSYPRVGWGEEYARRAFPVSRPAVPLPKGELAPPTGFSATSAVVVDDQTNTVLFKAEATAPRPLASITKLMTALVLADLPLTWSNSITVLPDDLDGSSHQLRAGETYTLDDVWNAALIGSSNSAVYALVRSSGLSTAEMVERMNERAQELGLVSLRFVDTAGLNKDNVGSALDVARLVKIALGNERIANALSRDQFILKPAGGRPRPLWSTNLLLTRWVPNTFPSGGVLGKTGYTNEAGYNFAARVKEASGRSVRVVVLGTTEPHDRFIEARDLALWAFDHYVWPSDPGYEAVRPVAANR